MRDAFRCGRVGPHISLCWPHRQILLAATDNSDSTAKREHLKSSIYVLHAIQTVCQPGHESCGEDYRHTTAAHGWIVDGMANAILF